MTVLQAIGEAPLDALQGREMSSSVKPPGRSEAQVTNMPRRADRRHRAELAKSSVAMIEVIGVALLGEVLRIPKSSSASGPVRRRRSTQMLVLQHVAASGSAATASVRIVLMGELAELGGLVARQSTFSAWNSGCSVDHISMRAPIGTPMAESRLQTPSNRSTMSGSPSDWSTSQSCDLGDETRFGHDLPVRVWCSSGLQFKARCGRRSRRESGPAPPPRCRADRSSSRPGRWWKITRRFTPAASQSRTPCSQVEWP